MKTEKLSNLTELTPLEKLSLEQVKELQTILLRLGYPVGVVDGLIGQRTRSAWQEYLEDFLQIKAKEIGPAIIGSLQKTLDETGDGRIHDFSTVDGTIEAIKWECQSQGIGFKSQIAYVLATVEWETARTFKPVREAFWLNEDWRKKNFRYYPYYGRGFVQLTWERNYLKYSQILGVDLVKKPDLAMDKNIALFILVHGFKTGAFTGRKITDYINPYLTDYKSARRCINGTDRANEIAKLAKQHLKQI